MSSTNKLYKMLYEDYKLEKNVDFWLHPQSGSYIITHNAVKKIVAKQSDKGFTIQTPMAKDLIVFKNGSEGGIHGDEVVLGITDHAQHALTDIVYVELPEVGQSCAVMDEIAIVESVKSASPIFAPLIGVVTAINEALDDTPELMNQDPYGEGWMVRMAINGSPNLPSLLGAAEYKAEIGE